MGDEGFADIDGSWKYEELPSNIKFGLDCWFERRFSFDRFRSEQDPGLVIGDRVRIYTWTTFNVEPTGLVQIGSDTTLVGAVFMCSERISVGRRCVISYNVTIADSDFHPLDPVARKRDALANSPYGDKSQRPAIVSKAVIIEDDVWIGIGAIVLKGVRIGKGARIGPGAVVTRDVAAMATMVGNPAVAIEETSP